jgi:ATP-binding cassette subfamily F protein 3
VACEYYSLELFESFSTMISFENVQKRFSSKIILSGLNASINPSRRIGLIGPNGAGKSVLMRMILRKEEPDAGTISMPKDLRIGHLPQEMEFPIITPLQLILEPFKHLLSAEDAATRLSEMHEKGLDTDEAERELAHIQTQQEHVDVWSLESRAKTILAGLGVPESKWTGDIHELSGGYRMRTVLGQLLLLKPDFLLLDEPTNHLDMDSIIWLERFLARHQGGILVISHDRDFLDRLTDTTAELSGGQLRQYNGTVSAYFAWREESLAAEERRVKNLNDQIEKAEKFVERFRAKATKAALAKSKMKQLDRLMDDLPSDVPTQTVRTAQFNFKAATVSGVVPLTVKNCSAHYGGPMIFSDVNLTFRRGDRVAIIGPNGAGKTTLLKVIAQDLAAATGEVIFGANALMRYYSQHRLEQLNAQQTVYETALQSSRGMTTSAVRSLLGAFLFSGDECDKRVAVLSGGEKSRLSLATLLADPGNLLLLDEPTNHLDVESVQRLAEGLSAYDGTMLFVSHDAWFVSQVATRIIEMRPGMVRDFPGTLAEYRSYIEAGYFGDTTESDTVPSKSKSETSESIKKQQRIDNREKKTKLSRRIEKLEKEIAVKERDIVIQKNVLHDPVNASNHALLISAQQAFETLEEECLELMEECETLNTELLALSGD